MADLNSTTLAAAVAVNDAVIRLTSVTNAQKDAVLVVDGEAMKVVADPIGTTVTVFRGYGGTKAAAHASGALIWTNPSYAYGVDEPAGAVDAKKLEYSPLVVPRTGAVFVPVNGRWVKVIDKGLPVTIPGGSGQIYTAAGAIQLVGGFHYLNAASGLAMTLAAPSGQTPEGTVLHIVSQTAQAHTVTYTAGFRGGTTSDDVATFGAAIGNYLIVVNLGGAWRVVASLNVSLG